MRLELENCREYASVYKTITDLNNEMQDRTRKLGTIPYLEKELANLRNKYESDMRIK